MATKTKTVTIKSEADLVNEFAMGKLVGYKPAESVDTGAFVYPVKLKLNEETKTFTVVKSSQKVETPKEEVKEDTTKVENVSTQNSSKKLSKGAIAGIVVGVLALIGVIAGIVIAVI